MLPYPGLDDPVDPVLHPPDVCSNLNRGLSYPVSNLMPWINVVSEEFHRFNIYFNLRATPAHSSLLRRI